MGSEMCIRDSSQAGALSDSSVESDLEDCSYVRAVPPHLRTWQTDEDRELARIRALAAHLREQPHLPYDPVDQTCTRPMLDQRALDNYVELP